MFIRLRAQALHTLQKQNCDILSTTISVKNPNILQTNRSWNNGLNEYQFKR